MIPSRGESLHSDVSTMGLGPTTPTNRPQSTKDHMMMTQSTGPIVRMMAQSTGPIVRMMAQSTGSIVLIYKSGPNMHPLPGR